MRRITGLLLTLIMLSGSAARAATVTVMFPASDRALVNPFIGNVAWATNDSEQEQPFTLVYATLRWADYEPEPGVYDFNTFEEVNHFTDWRAQGKRLILRFVMDVPADKKHLDIPEWLYEQTGDGAYYATPYGRGYCPDYTNGDLIAAHRRAVAALGARYDTDPFVVYVELGSLGHWGEWHVYPTAGTMPGEAIRDEYARAYTDAFTHVKLMMRRPFRFAEENGLGLYNDAAGDAAATETWLSWIAEGGEYDETGEPDALSAMPEGWKTAPVGGELSTRIDDATMLGELLPQTIALLSRSHTSWIGPSSFVDVERDGPLQAAVDQVNRMVGYRLRVSQATAVLSGEACTLMLTWQNDGVAPFYFAWTAALRIEDETGDSRVVPLSLPLPSLLAGSERMVSVSFPLSAKETLSVGILDPQTGEPGVALAMDAADTDGWYQLMTVSP